MKVVQCDGDGCSTEVRVKGKDWESALRAMLWKPGEVAGRYTCPLCFGKRYNKWLQEYWSSI